MGQPFMGVGRHPGVLFVPGMVTKHLLAPLTSCQSPTAAFILVKWTEQIKDPQEPPRSCLRHSLSPERV